MIKTPEKIVKQVCSCMPNEDTLFDVAELFKIFGDSTRIKILYALLEHDMAVNDIADVLGMTQSAISHQLRILKTSGLVRFTREGKSMVYSLADAHVSSILSKGMEHVCEK
jgi:ArsR family transcriptional regulator